MTISSSKVEYVATTSTTCQVVWLWGILEDLQHKEKEKTHIFCKNNSAISLSKIHVFHGKSKHIDTFMYSKANILIPYTTLLESL